jgi:hypothetical protein
MTAVHRSITSAESVTHADGADRGSPTAVTATATATATAIAVTEAATAVQSAPPTESGEQIASTSLPHAANEQAEPLFYEPSATLEEAPSPRAGSNPEADDIPPEALAYPSAPSM